MTRTLLPTAAPARVWAMMRTLVGGHRGLLLAAVAVLFVGTAAELVVPALLGRIVDLVLARSPAAAITGPVVLILLASVLHGLLRGYGIALVGQLGELVLARLREKVVHRVLRVPLDDVERSGTGDLLARVSGDVAAVSTAVRVALPEFVTSGLTVALTLVGLAVLDPRLALAGLAALPVQVLAVRWYLRRVPHRFATLRVAEGSLAQQLMDSVLGSATVRAFRLGGRHRDLVRQRSTQTIAANERAIAGQASFAQRLNAAELAGLGAILIVGFLLVRAGGGSVGEATAAALYFQRLFNPLNGLLSVLDRAQTALAALARLVGVADLPEPIEPDRPRRPADSSVVVAGLSHAYLPGHDVLTGIELALAPGERVALVGASGAGKTTLAKLIAGVHHPAKGSVALGGVRIAELGEQATRDAVVLVTQEVHVFAGRLADDLRLARPESTDTELRDALHRVGALGWVGALPDGLDTVVGRGGHSLTPTQSQQLALARLVLTDPPIAILDEASAEAGSVGARELETAAAEALRGRTALVIAHRLTQAATADRIVVLDAGRIVEIGTHEELLAAEADYARLWAAWSGTQQTG